MILLNKTNCYTISGNLVKLLGGGAENYFLTTPIGTPICNYLFQQDDLQSLTI
jgi:hypothetical protein